MRSPLVRFFVWIYTFVVTLFVVCCILSERVMGRFLVVGLGLQKWVVRDEDICITIKCMMGSSITS